MRRVFLDRHVLLDLKWWHWAITVVLLGAHLLGWPWAIEAALALCAVMAVYYLFRFRSLQAFAVQTRLAYFGLLSLGLLPDMQWLYYIALVGTSARITVGYCFLGRLLGLAWFNRTEPLTFSLVTRQLLAAPEGALFNWHP